MSEFSISESIRFGWETFKKRPWFFIGVLVCVFIAYSVISLVTGPSHGQQGFMLSFMSIVSGVLGVVVEMMLINLALKAHDNVEAVQFSNAWGELPFWRYLAVKVLAGLIVMVGFVLLIVPGVIAALVLIFSNYLVVDKGLGPIQALKESARITKGHRWHLLGFVLVVAGLNILGVIALFLGLLITIPVTMLAMVHVYRKLEHAASEAALVSV